MELIESRKMQSYTLHVAGLYGRKRTPQRGSFDLCELPADAAQPGEDELRRTVAARLELERVKPGARWALVRVELERRRERSPDGIEYTITAFGLTSGETLLKGEVP